VSTTTTQSFLPTLPSHTYSTSDPFEDFSDSFLPSTLDMIDEDVEKIYQSLIESA
jgi:hypothetical protein